MQTSLCKLYKLCKAKELEFAVVVFCPNKNQSEEDDCVRSLLRNPDYCGWLYVPFDYTVSRRLDMMCMYSCEDKLVVFGPNGGYVDLDGKEVYLEYGIGAYPFTKQAAWDMEVDKLRGSSLKDLLSRCEIHSLSRDGQTLPVSSLEDADVLVYFGWAPLNPHPSAWERQLLKWINEMKSASRRRLEVIFICTYVDAKTIPSLEKYCSEFGWLLPSPHEIDRNDTLVKSIFGKDGLWGGSLGAFDGSNGRVLRICLESSLLAQFVPATFPQSDDELRTDVRGLLNSQLGDDTWWNALEE